MKLVIVVPCYNEEEVLAETTRQLSSVVDELLSDGKIDEGKILYVDDGSRDRTWELIRGFSETHPSVTGLKLAHNVGHQQALWAGLEWAASHADAAVSIDADLQDDVRSIVGMVDAWRGGADIVYGVRRERTTDTFFKKNTAQAFYKLMNALGGDIVYNHADFRLMSRKMTNAVLNMAEYNRFSKGIFSWVGFKTKWFDYENIERVAGTTKWNFWGLFKYSIEGIVGFSTTPLLMAAGVGVLFCLLAFIGIIFVIVRALMFGDPTSGWPSLVCIILLCSGVQLFCTGIVGEYLAKTYLEVKHRPIYIVAETEEDKK